MSHLLGIDWFLTRRSNGEDDHLLAPDCEQSSITAFPVQTEKEMPYLLGEKAILVSQTTGEGKITQAKQSPARNDR